MNRTILVIDDDVAIQKVLVTHLTNWRTEVCSAGDGESGLALAAECLPDLILLDVDMPGMNGHEVCRRLKSQPTTRAIPVAFITSENSINDKIVGLDEGAVDYITKPFDPYEVGARTRAAFRAKSLVETVTANTMVDQLTGLASRAAFEKQLQAELARSRRSSQPLGCVLIEPDRMEDLALTEGFAACDKILCDVAAVLAEACREEDALFRYSDLVFAVLAPNVDIENVPKMGERLQQFVESHHTLCGRSSLQITASVGVAISRFSFGRTLAQQAEAALAKARCGGGHNVVIGDEISQLRLAN